MTTSNDTLSQTTYTCDDCGARTSRETSSVWADEMVLCDLHGSGRYAGLRREIEAMVEELRGLNDPLVPCQFCQGTGYIEYFKHIDEGVCYNCKGTGMERNGELPADMARCAGCDHAIAAGLIWGVEDAEVCPNCWEDVHGYPRWSDPRDYGFYEHPVCETVSKVDNRRGCSLCLDIAGKQGEDW